MSSLVMTGTCDEVESYHMYIAVIIFVWHMAYGKAVTYKGKQLRIYDSAYQIRKIEGCRKLIMSASYIWHSYDKLQFGLFVLSSKLKQK